MGQFVELVERELSFPVSLRPVLYRNKDGSLQESSKHRLVVRDETPLADAIPLATVTDEYKLVRHDVMMRPIAEYLDSKGFVPARVGRRPAVRIDNGGARVHIYAKHPDIRKVIGGRDVLAMVNMGNSYDTSLSLNVGAGALVQICTNGATAPLKGGGFKYKKKHTSGVITNWIDAVANAMDNMGNVLEYYEALDQHRMMEKEARHLVEENIGKRPVDRIIKLWTEGIGNRGERTTWDLYNAGTQWLSHEDKADTLNSERKNQKFLTALVEAVGV